MIGLYPSMETHGEEPLFGGLFDAVVEERGGWTPKGGYQNRVIWKCRHGHPGQGEALACARARIKDMDQGRA